MNENETHKKKVKIEIFNDNFQNFKRYGIPKAQLVIADIPYNIGNNFYGSNPMWYNGGDNKNGESKFAGKAAFNSDFSFNIAEYFHFCNRLLKPEPKNSGARGRSSEAPCMIVFCSFEQQQTVIKYAEKYGFMHYIPLVFIKNYSPHWFEWRRDGKDIPKIHPSQKPVAVLKKLIEIFTDEGDTVIDPCCGSGSTLRACKELNRSCYGFEISRDFYKKAKEEMLNIETAENQVKSNGYQMSLFS
ncbi:MAG: DNA-methyltransferase [Hominimerdicola sp.]